MIFHSPDTSFKRLAGCWKRAARFGSAGPLNAAHPLAAAWDNCKMFLDAESRDDRATEIAYSIVCMHWFALKVEDFSRSNMLADDAGLAAILQEWKDRMPFDPTRLAAAK